jgi:hypothetical protein
MEEKVVPNETITALYSFMIVAASGSDSFRQAL